MSLILGPDGSRIEVQQASLRPAKIGDMVHYAQVVDEPEVYPAVINQVGVGNVCALTVFMPGMVAHVENCPEAVGLYRDKHWSYPQELEGPKGGVQ